jgi:LacI family transcriptional regulator
MNRPEKNASADATFADVAKRAKVSKMTVSRVVSGRGYVSEGTRARVSAALAKCGYRANPLVQALMAGVRRARVGRTANLAWVTRGEGAIRRGSPRALILGGARARAEELGFGLAEVELPAGEGLRTERVGQILRTRGAAGIIVSPLVKPGGTLPMPWDDFACATIGTSLAAPALHSAMAHHVRIMGRVLEELEARGYSRPVFATLRDTDERMEHGQAMAWQYRQLLRPLRERVDTAFADLWAVRDWADWLERVRPDAVVGAHPEMRQLLESAGARVPSEIGFVTTSWREDHPSCAGVRQPFAEIGAAAVDLVVAQIHRNERGLPRIPKTVLVDGAWVEGLSLRTALPPRLEKAAGAEVTKAKRPPAMSRASNH